MRYVPGPDDVIIQTVAASRHRGRDTDDRSRRTESAHSYDALVYTNLPIELSKSHAGYADQLRTLPLRGVERLWIPDRAFGPWLASFIEGEKGLEMMRDKMLEMMSAPLQDLLASAPHRMRIWWSNLTPELDELPWELAVEAGRRHAHHNVALLRGLPPETPIPPLPLTNEPRLGIIGSRSLWPDWAHAVAARMADSIVVLDGSTREALSQAVASGIELIHIFTDGIVSSALDGILYDHSADESSRLISSSELSRILNESRVVLMSLSPADALSPEMMEIGNRPVLSAYRAFRHIGASRRPLPSILAPLGPVPQEMMADFWSAFYAELATGWHLTESLRKAQSKFEYSVPIALFSRHAGGKLFHAPGMRTTGEHDPMESRGSLLGSQQLTGQLSEIIGKYKRALPKSIELLLDAENGLQSRLRNELEELIDRDGEV